MIIKDSVVIKLYDLIDSIKETEEYKKVDEAYRHLMNDEQGKSLVNAFLKAKELYSFGETKESLLKVKEAKVALYTYDLFIKYNEALKAYNELAKEIEESINSTLYKESVKEVLKLR